MTTLLIIAALGQVRYADEFARPSAARQSAEVTEAWPERPIPRVFRVVTQRETPQRETFRVALADEPPKAHDVARPAPAKGVDDYSARDNDRDNRIFQLEQEVKNLTRRLAELERGRAVTGAPRTAVVCPMGCPQCETPCKTPGECGHPECRGSGPAARRAVVPAYSAADEWRPFTGNPAYEVYGREEADGVFRYTQTRARAGYSAPPAVTYTTMPASLGVYASPYAGVYGTPYYGATYGSGFGAVCGPGGCSPVGAVRGIFGRILGR